MTGLRKQKLNQRRLQSQNSFRYRALIQSNKKPSLVLAGATFLNLKEYYWIICLALS